MTEPSSKPPGPIPLDYAGRPPSMAAAVGSMVWGLCGLPLLLVAGLGVIPALFGVIEGFWALSRIAKDPNRYAGKGFAITGIATGLSALLIAAVVAAIPPRSREIANRAVCSANLRGIVQACIVYSASEADAFPTAGAPAAAGEYTVAFGVVSDPQPNGSAALREAHSKAAGNPVASVWMLVLRESLHPKLLVCRSDPAGMGSQSPVMPPGATAGASPYYLSPEKPGQFSYSIAYPWNGAGKSATLNYWWMNRSDSAVPVAADMAPLDGSGSPAVRTAPTSVPGSGKGWNSFNHGGRGQNVAFQDGHVDWLASPVSYFADRDNIWSVGEVGRTSDGTGGTAGGPGRVPVPAKGWAASGPFDLIMVPVRDGPTGAVR